MPDEGEGQVIRTISTREVYRNPWMILREDQIERPDGSRGIYSVVEKPDFALIIPQEDDEFHLVEQYRYPIRGRYWEFPQGTFGAGKDGTRSELAHLELAEETGFTCNQLTHLGHLFCSHGTSRQGFDVYLAQDLVPGEPRRELEEQDMRQKWVSRSEFVTMIRESKIKDDSTLAAFALLCLHERGALG
jgi:8-oxo-dGTP pyrophosphatase MutT (NUDIX family)